MKKLSGILIAALLLLASFAYAGSAGGPPYRPSAVAITGGAINGTTVGANTPSTGAFTSISGTSISGTSISSTNDVIFGSLEANAAVNIVSSVASGGVGKSELLLGNSSTGARGWLSFNHADDTLGLGMVGVGAFTLTTTGINNTAIGATTPGTGAFTTLSASGAVSGAGITALHAAPGPIGSTTPGTGAFTSLYDSSATFKMLVLSGTYPVISSGFGTNPLLSTPAHTPAFKIRVGTGGTASSGVVTMPASISGWVCNIYTLAMRADRLTKVSDESTTSVTVTNYILSTGAAVAWNASDDLMFLCMAR